MSFRQLNDEIDWVTRANSTYHPLAPKAGILIIGDRGLEYQAKSGQGFIQCPWETIEHIYVQMFFKGKYIRGIDVITTDDQHFEFIISKGKKTLRHMRKYLERNQFSARQGNLLGMFKK